MTPPKVSYIEGKIWWKLIRPSFKERVMGENKSCTISKEVFKPLDLRHFVRTLMEVCLVYQNIRNVTWVN